MDLFSRAAEESLKNDAPLAHRMRPQQLDDVVGQEHLLGPDKFLRKAWQAGQSPSCLFFGPPGTGKTTLARIAAQMSGAHFDQINAVTAGVADIRRVVEDAKMRRGMGGAKRTVLFVDEIHRFNKSQQDALLPYVEEGLVTLMGATTTNPMVSVNAALVSRARLFELRPLTDGNIRQLLERALVDEVRGIGHLHAEVEPAALDHLVHCSGGDARTALNALELSVVLTDAEPDPPGTDRRAGVRYVDLARAEEALQRRAVVYDKDADEHYHVISAYIKSIRGSDPDGAVYWLARMIYAGEDPRFLARRLVISASEDIGLADPQALVVAEAAARAVEFIGMPEGRIPLAQATIYLACAPKSNAAYSAINAALADIEKGAAPPVPMHLRDGSQGADRRLGYGQGYKYPHDFPGHWVQQEYLPPELGDRRYFTPSDQGKERGLHDWLQRLRRPGGPYKDA